MTDTNADRIATLAKQAAEHQAYAQRCDDEIVTIRANEDIGLLTRLVLSSRDLTRVEFAATDHLAGRIAALLPPPPR